MNLEEPDPRVISKDRWPIPLNNQKFLISLRGTLSLHFSSTYPTMLINSNPIKIDMSKTNSELLHLNDPILIMHLAESLIKPFNYTEG